MALLYADEDRAQRNTKLADYGLETPRCSVALDLGGGGEGDEDSSLTRQSSRGGSARRENRWGGDE